MIEIYEDTLEPRASTASWHELMTPEQLRRGQYYAQQYVQRKAEISDYIAEWEKEQKLYECQRDKDPTDPKAPCNFYPVLTPDIEGQAAAMVDSNMEFNYVTSNPGHEPYVKKLNPASVYNRRKSKFMLHAKDATRSYLLHGSSWISVAWEKSLDAGPGRPNGHGRFSTPSLVNVFVDGKIKDYKDLQYAEYIIEELGFQSIDSARQEYGEDLANALATGMGEYEGTTPEVSNDDARGWTLLYVWTRSNKDHHLQLIEMDVNGLILRESDPSKPYYEDVDDEYPYYFIRGMPKAGCFYGFGDGRILARFQELINCLLDEAEYGARFASQGKLAVDPAGEMADGQLNSDPKKAISIINPHQNLLQLRGMGVDQVLFNMAELVLRGVQSGSRYSDIMNGIMNTSSATATQINGQLSQGAIGINDKKADIVAAMSWADRYALKLCLGKWDKPFWAGIGDESVYFDPGEVRRVPAFIGRTVERTKKIIDGFSANGQDFSEKDIPAYEVVTDENGDPIMVALDFDVDVVIGNAIPRGKNDMYNIILGLMQLQVLDPETQMMVPFLETKIARKLMQEALGIKLSDESTEQDQTDEGSILMNQLKPTQLNPVGDNDTIQTPQGAPVQAQAEPQMANVPGTPGMDLRGLSL